MPVNFSAWHSNNLNGQPSSQPALYSPFDSLPNTSHAEAPFYAALPVAQANNFLQPFQLNGANTFGGFHQEQNPMDMASYMISPPNFMTLVFEPEYLENMNMAFPRAGSMAHAAGNIAAGLHAPSSSGFLQTNWVNPQRVENRTGYGSESSQGHYHPRHGVHTAMNQMGVSIGGGRGRGRASSSQAVQRVARRGTRGRGPSPRIRCPTAAERRRRLIDEVHEALDIYRREGGGHLRELIALGEQLGIIANEVEQIQVVENGLTEDTITARLTQETDHPVATGAEEHRACSICQDEYGESDLLGKLDCGHDYHFECIKQWLMRKNSSPCAGTEL